GPRRPQDRVALSNMRPQWDKDLPLVFGKKKAAAGSDGRGGGAGAEDPGFDGVETTLDGHTFKLKHGAVVVAAITSCTNTSNPSVMMAARWVARNARAHCVPHS